MGDVAALVLGDVAALVALLQKGVGGCNRELRFPALLIALEEDAKAGEGEERVHVVHRAGLGEEELR